MCDALVRLSGLDLIISNIAIHHLPSAAKRQLFSQAYASLRPGGVLAFADQLCGATDHIYQSHLQQWRRDSLAAGGTEEEWQMWMEHQRRHDHHDSLSNHLTWLHDLGFTNSDCIWRYLLWSVIQARR